MNLQKHMEKYIHRKMVEHGNNTLFNALSKTIAEAIVEYDRMKREETSRAAESMRGRFDK